MCSLQNLSKPALLTVTVVCLMLASSTEKNTSASDAPTPGHSYHGEVFNDGPRQEAYLMGGTGVIDFPVETESLLAQQFINQGVGQLHGFWYFEAERSFRQAAAIDPNCAAAYWGMAMANRNNSERAKAFIQQAVERKEFADERLRMYIEALKAFYDADEKDKKERGQNYIKALESIVHEFPHDIDAKAWLVYQIWNQRNNDLPISSHVAVDALIQQVLNVQAMHPIHHYRIHLWDYEKPAQALEAAARCGQAAPAIAHMWHMPGHIYSRLHRYQDAVWQQEASARTDHAHMMRDQVLPDQIHNFAHNNEWLIRNLIHIGRFNDALTLAKNMVSLPRHPKYNMLDKKGSYFYGRQRIWDILLAGEMWQRVTELSDTPFLQPTEDVAEKTRYAHGMGVAHAYLGNYAKAARELVALETHKVDLQAQLQAERQNTSSEKASQEEGEKLKSNVCEEESDEKKVKKRLESVEQSIEELYGHLAFASEDFQSALTHFTASNADSRYRIRCHLKLKDYEKAVEIARQGVEKNEGEVLPLVNLVEALWTKTNYVQQIDSAKDPDSADFQKKVRSSFKKLRQLAGRSDLRTPCLARLTHIAAALDLPSDWRLANQESTDTGQRPALQSLGPVSWTPQRVPSWTLPDATGNAVSLADYHGRPTVLIFYLGYGCLHCAEQLQAFGPHAKAFSDEGISLVAVSTDTQADLKVSIENYQEGAFPLTLVSDESLRTFQQYRAYDDLEQQPLHGTFLIDGDGYLRWHDTSFEPFMDHEFLLQEAKRLLAQDTDKQ